MKYIKSIDSFFLSEGVMSSVSNFLKSQYNNIFNSPNQKLNNLFVDFTKKVDIEKNVYNLYQRFVRANQTVVQNEINNAETVDDVNRIISDEIKYFYFSLKPIVNKLQNDDFTMINVFEKSRDKRLQKLMSYPEEQFSNAAQQYVNEILPEIKTDAGLDKQTQVQPAQVQPAQTVEKIKYILEAISEQDLVTYKKAAIKWINMSLFDLLKPKFQLLNQLDASTSNIVDQLSKQIKSTPNDNTKKMILNKIINMDKEQLKNLALSLGITEEEIGKL